MPTKTNQPRDWFNIQNEDEALEIYIYGPIGSSWWNDDATSAKELIDLLNDNREKSVNVHVNSEGGNVFDGFAMYTCLRNHKGTVTVYVDGLAASAASYIIAAADKIVMSDVAWLMIHNASGSCWGNKTALRKQADTLENIDNTIAHIYAQRSSGKDKAYFLDLMDKETWIGATEAEELGLCDEVTEALPVAARFEWHNSLELEKAPETARAAIGLMVAGQLADDESTDPGDTTEIIEPQNNSDEPGQEAQPVAAAQERPVVLLGGKLY